MFSYNCFPHMLCCVVTKVISVLNKTHLTLQKVDRYTFLYSGRLSPSIAGRALSLKQYIYIYMYVYLYIYIYIYMYVCMYVYLENSSRKIRALIG